MPECFDLCEGSSWLTVFISGVVGDREREGKRERRGGEKKRKGEERRDSLLSPVGWWPHCEDILYLSSSVTYHLHPELHTVQSNPVYLF